MQTVKGESMSKPFDLVVGRNTYEIFAAHWPHTDDPGAEPLNKATKHVASSTRRELGWENSTLIEIIPLVLGQRKRLLDCWHAAPRRKAKTGRISVSDSPGRWQAESRTSAQQENACAASQRPIVPTTGGSVASPSVRRRPKGERRWREVDDGGSLRSEVPTVSSLSP